MNRKKILVVDDEEDMRKMVVSALETFGFQVFEASNGQEGLQAFLKYTPDLALLDIRMPGIGGIQLCELLRHRSKVPIIMFSAVDERTEVIEAIKKGANDYILKTAGPAEVVERVTRVLDSSKKGQGEANDGIQADEEKWSIKENDVPVAVLVHSDRRASTEMREILRQSQIQVRDAKTGEEALMAVRRFNPLLVVAESTLADMTANDLLKAIKDHPRRGGIAVIVAAAKRSPEAQRRAMYFGAQDYIHAPWDDGRLALALRTAMFTAQQYRKQVKKVLAERREAKGLGVGEDAGKKPDESKTRKKAS